MKIFFPILFTLISIAVFIFGLNPFYKDVSKFKEDIASYNTALDDSTNLQKIQENLISSYNQISKLEKERLDNFLPDSVNNIQFILELERIAGLHNMPIKNVKFETLRKQKDSVDQNIIVSQDPKDNLPYGIFPLEFTTEGTYDNFTLFIKDLEKNLRLVDIKSISFNVPDKETIKDVEGADPNIYRYTLKVETYWLK